MSSNLTLLCVVETESTPFPVEIKSSESIAVLKNKIKTEISKTLEGVDAKDLTLWRVSIKDYRDDGVPILLRLQPEKTKLTATDDVSDVFEAQPSKKTISIVVQRPVQAPIAFQKQTVFQAFPDGLPYQEPGPLLRTAGQDWTYQPHPALYDELLPTIRDHFDNFSKGLRDKSNIPLYLFLSGAGTGKSRNAQEFHHSARLCLTENDQELQNKIGHAWVFHVTLENGTSVSERELNDPIHAIGIRMLQQLLPGKDIYEVQREYVEPHPMDVLDLIAHNAGLKKELATVILVVDGLQSFMSDPKDGRDKKSAFYRSLTSIRDLAIKSVFMMVCCTATVTSPIEKALATSHSKRVVLPLASLESPRTQEGDISVPVFDEDDHIIKVLVKDCGGHGRALESLQLAITTAGEDYTIESLMRILHYRLHDLYSEAFLMTSCTAQAIARAVLTRTLLDPNKLLAGTDKLPGELAIPGLIRYEQKMGLGREGYLTAPYIWIWLMSIGNDPLLNKFRFNDGQELESKLDPRLPPGAQFWQHFEHFVATFRCLKSRVLEDNKPTSISTIHAGARLNGDIRFTNHHLHLAIASHQVPTKSASYPRIMPTVRCENVNVNIRKGDHCIINAPSAPFGDSFTGLDTKPFCNEVHQCKLVADGGKIDYFAERGKAASDNDFFMLFTVTTLPNFALPSLSGIVDGSTWEDYFGPFAGRAFIFATIGALNINSAPRKELMRMESVGSAKADIIIQERTKRPFEDIEDANKRLRGVSKRLLATFSYS
ncbi:hypothetical protein EMPS_09927 [Entomortierella parvispora]|uniref:Crinkler effector protein N-terminal domain-containing protein n=1 Tax=Entomortierella parvispora TaxID=205924 RepID=A0A9P3HJH6_9FUNG|nr:hypothetical protein EMPS_09927 [Entomortierella parvispora]